MEFLGNDHVIEMNEIHHVCKETGDVGALYTGRDWTQRGNTIRHNFIHDLAGPGTVGAIGVYLDDCYSGTHVYGNVIHKATYAILIGGGRDNTVRNNIVSHARVGIHISTREVGDLTDLKSNTLAKRLAAIPYKEPPWSERFPELVGILDDDPGVPKGNVIERNLVVACTHPLGEPDLEAHKENNRIDNNLVVGEGDEEAGFVDAQQLDFRLKSDSRVWKQVKGFERIPLEKVGLYVDEYRKTVSEE